MVRRYWIIVAVVVVILVGVVVYQTTTTPKQVTLLVYSADAYVGEANAFIKNFSSSEGVSASLKSAGSFALAQQIAQGSPCDVFFSIARPAIQKQYLRSQFPGWAVAIASDQVVIAYSNSIASNSEANTIITNYNTLKGKLNMLQWKLLFDQLTSGAVKVGIANPATDPAGLRGWLVLEAAGYVYAGNQSYYVERIISSNGNVTGEHAANLVAPLETGEIQFLFIYRSFAISHKLNFIALENKINFGDLSMDSFYSKFTYKLATGIQKGGPTVLYVTVPLNSENKDIAYRFVVYVAKHAQILRSFGMIPLNPVIIYNSTALPAQIQQLLNDGTAKIGGNL
jgi:molybdate/tungstate transport system substrate-binding protein